MQKLLKISEQTAWQVLGKLASSFSVFLTLALIARNYGETGTGVYTLVVTYISMFFIVVDFGLNAIILPKLALDRNIGNSLFNLRFYWSLILVALADILVFLLPIGNEPFRISVLLGSVIIVFVGFYTSANLIFQEKLRYEYSSISSVVGAVVFFLVALLLIFMKVPVELVIISSIFGWLSNNIAASFFLRSLFNFKLKSFSFSFAKDSLRVAWPISITLFLNVLYFRVDAFLLASMKGFSEVGIYNTSFMVFQNALVIPTFIMNSYYPIILRELGNINLLLRQLKLAFAIMLGLGVLGMILTFLTSEMLLGIITGGEGFTGSVLALNILAISFPAFFGSSLLMWVYVSFKRLKLILVIYSIGLLINLFLNLLFIPSYSFSAAAWVTVFSEYFILTLQLVILYGWRKKILR